MKPTGWQIKPFLRFLVCLTLVWADLLRRALSGIAANARMRAQDARAKAKRYGRPNRLMQKAEKPREVAEWLLQPKLSFHHRPSSPTSSAAKQIANGLEHQIEIKTGVLMALIDQIKPRLGRDTDARVNRIRFLRRLAARQ